jgi:membrane-bound lytic murein transglycosylase MltF
LIRVAGVGLLLLLGQPLQAQHSASRYDHVFRKYSKRFFGAGYDWRIFKAQGMTESGLDPAVRSAAGARGIMQLMPSTYREVQSKNPAWGSIDDVEWNLAAGIYHDRQQWSLWSGDVVDEDQHRFMFASYNAGRVTILTAQRLARENRLDPRHWISIATIAPKVPRWRHGETLTYLARIGENLSRLDRKGRVVPAQQAVASGR